MIALFAASAVYLSALQATIVAPTNAFRGCLRDAATKAKTEKVGGDAIETYLKAACSQQMGSLTDSVVAFRTKNGMTRKAAIADASMTVEDYLAAPVDHYKYLADMEAPKAAPAAATAPAIASAQAAPKPGATPAAKVTPAASQVQKP